MTLEEANGLGYYLTQIQDLYVWQRFSLLLSPVDYYFTQEEALDAFSYVSREAFHNKLMDELNAQDA